MSAPRKDFGTVLVANRGEIACRVLRTAQRLGYRTVAVYSDADAGAPHVRLADAAVRLGPAPATESYLNMAALLAAAQRCGADAIHPGYGFLSERPEFAEAVLAAGLVFIGPPAQAMRDMGDKAGAKQRMLAAGVPCAPGYLGEDQSEATLNHEARQLGTPLLVKAVAGGGGRGIRIVHDLADLSEAVAGARREAERAFGDGRLMLERLIDGGRHIEIQVFADAHGACIHLGERDCTVQRRRQKLVEETPSAIVDDKLRSLMGRDAVAAAQAVGYVGAGTVEFIVDGQGRHFFLEMNTRLQVEHPVTEAVTGLDLVEWQLRIAAGEPLPLTQAQLRLDGHAIEVRLYAEDAYAGWAPQTGTVLAWRPQDAGLRIDHGIAEGDAVTPHYDALLAKFVAHGRDRSDALRRLRRALHHAPLFGPRTNAGFLSRLLAHPDVAAARMSTSRLDEWAQAGAALLQRPAPGDEAWRIAAAVLGGAGQGFQIRLQEDDQTRALAVPVPGVTVHALVDGWLQVEVDGLRQRLPAHLDRTVQPARLHLALDAEVFVFGEVSAWPTASQDTDRRALRAPVAGTLSQLRVAVGDSVAAGQPLACVEAMKMELWLHAPDAGRVKAVHGQLGASVAAGALLIELQDPEE